MEENTGLLPSNFCAGFHAFAVKSNQALSLSKSLPLYYKVRFLLKKRDTLELFAGEL